MRDVLKDAAGSIVSAIAMTIGAVLWGEAFAPLWEVSPKRFVLTCVMAALIGAGIACSITVTAGRKRRARDAECIKELEAEHDELKTRLDAIDSAEARDKARIDEFTDAQLELMLKMADAPSPGLSLFITSHDHTLAMSLMEPPEVIAMFIDETRSTCAWYLLPKWNGWVRRNRREIDNRLSNL